MQPVDKAYIEQRLNDLEMLFNDKRRATDNLIAQVRKGEDELLQLQGRFSELQDVLAKLPEGDAITQESQPEQAMKAKELVHAKQK